MHKIIWNITKKCGYHCRICSTASESRRELLYDEKKIVLHKIVSLGKTLTEVDFAGGDPLYDKDSRLIIKEAIETLGKEKVCVTTTAKGIELLNKEEKNLFLYNCELSFDDIDGSDKKIRKEPLYSCDNIQSINQNKEFIKNLTINIPIFKTDIEIGHLENIIRAVNSIDIENIEVNILRYMPVGNASLITYPERYTPMKIIDYLTRSLKKTITVHLQCALRGALLGEKNNCTMFLGKMGLDCEGNVFMCAWSGYITDKIELNPFYLGNLLEKDLKDLTSNEEAKRIYQGITRFSRNCCIFSYLCSEPHEMFSGSDPLVKEEVYDKRSVQVS